MITCTVVLDFYGVLACNSSLIQVSAYQIQSSVDNLLLAGNIVHMV